jgi:hypothetical protein
VCSGYLHLPVTASLSISALMQSCPTIHSQDLFADWSDERVMSFPPAPSHLLNFAVNILPARGGRSADMDGLSTVSRRTEDQVRARRNLAIPSM